VPGGGAAGDRDRSRAGWPRSPAGAHDGASCVRPAGIRHYEDMIRIPHINPSARLTAFSPACPAGPCGRASSQPSRRLPERRAGARLGSGSLRTSPEQARSLLLEYVAEANALAKHPAFYNSITTNCTTAVAKLIRAAGGTLPFDWRLIVNGYLPGYLYERGAVVLTIPLNELMALARIHERAKAADRSPDFPRLTRIGVPSPLAADRAVTRDRAALSWGAV